MYHLENDLDEIAEGKEDWIKFLKEFYTPFNKNLLKKYEEVSKSDIAETKTDKICPK